MMSNKLKFGVVVLLLLAALSIACSGGNNSKESLMADINCQDRYDYYIMWTVDGEDGQPISDAIQGTTSGQFTKLIEGKNLTMTATATKTQYTLNELEVAIAGEKMTRKHRTDEAFETVQVELTGKEDQEWQE